MKMKSLFFLVPIALLGASEGQAAIDNYSYVAKPSTGSNLRRHQHDRSVSSGNLPDFGRLVVRYQ